MSASKCPAGHWVLRVIQPDAAIDGNRFNHEIFRPRDIDNGELSIYLYPEDRHPEQAFYHWRRVFRNTKALGIAGITCDEATLTNSKLTVESKPTKKIQDHGIINFIELTFAEQEQAMRKLAAHAEKRRFISVLRPENEAPV